MENYLENITYDELSVGDTATIHKLIEKRDVLLFADLSGDVNPIHIDEDYAATTEFKRPICHGMLTGALISAALATKIPGPGSIYIGQQLQFRRPVYVGEKVKIVLEVKEKKTKRNIVHIDCKVINSEEKVVVKGLAEVIAPSQKLRIPKPQLPEISIE